MSTVHAMSKLAGIGTIHIEVHPEAQEWAPSNDILDKLRELVHRPLKVEMFPRSMVPEIWSRDHDNKPFEKEPYSFRAYASGDRCVCFVDETETPESALWVLLHELAHMELPASKYLFKAYRMATAPNYFESDETHEADPEEQMANMAATQWMNALGFGPVSFPRMWWRNRVNNTMTKEAILNFNTAKNNAVNFFKKKVAPTVVNASPSATKVVGDISSNIQTGMGTGGISQVTSNLGRQVGNITHDFAKRKDILKATQAEAKKIARYKRKYAHKPETRDRLIEMATGNNWRRPKLEASKKVWGNTGASIGMALPEVAQGVGQMTGKFASIHKEGQKSCGCSYCEKVDKLRPKKKLVKEAKMSMPTKVIGVVTAASLLAAMNDYRKGFKGRKLRQKLPELLTDPKSSVDASSFLAQIDPEVTVIDSSEKIIPILKNHEAFPSSFRSRFKKMTKSDQTAVGDAIFKHFTTNNAVAMAHKDGSHPVIMCAKKVPIAIILHEYGHTLDYKHRGHGAAGYGSTWNKLTQNWSRKSYDKVVYDAETTAWDNAEKIIKKENPEQYDKKTWKNTRDAALGSYSSSFYKTRGSNLLGIGTLTGVLTGLSMANDSDNERFEKARKERQREEQRNKNKKRSGSYYNSWADDDDFFKDFDF